MASFQTLLCGSALVGNTNIMDYIKGNHFQPHSTWLGGPILQPQPAHTVHLNLGARPACPLRPPQAELAEPQRGRIGQVVTVRWVACPLAYANKPVSPGFSKTLPWILSWLLSGAKSTGWELEQCERSPHGSWKKRRIYPYSNTSR